MFATAQQLQHPTSGADVRGLAQNLTFTFRNRIAPQNKAAADSQGDVFGLVEAQSQHELGRTFLAANAAFRGRRRLDDVEFVARLNQEFAAPRRAAGENQFGRPHIKAKARKKERRKYNDEIKMTETIAGDKRHS